MRGFEAPSPDSLLDSQTENSLFVEQYLNVGWMDMFQRHHRRCKTSERRCLPGKQVAIGNLEVPLRGWVAQKTSVEVSFRHLP